LTIKEYSLLERSLRGDVSLSHKLCRNQPISKNDLIMEILEEIHSIEYDEGEGTPIEFRIYEPGRTLLKTIIEKIYLGGADKYIEYLSSDDFVNLKLDEKDIMITFRIT
jgi:hypothetical protein